MIAVLAFASASADVRTVAGDHRCILARDQDEMLLVTGDADAVVLGAENPARGAGLARGAGMVGSTPYDVSRPRSPEGEPANPQPERR